VAEKRAEVEESTADREIVLTRVFDAPRKMVWQAWGKTRLTLRLVFVSAEARDQNVREYHSIEGEQTLARLAEHLSTRLAARGNGGMQ
jgi:uncharacterized protein YndB with AHSA1/START domain